MAMNVQSVMDDKNLTKNFKNLRINVVQPSNDDMVCKCPTYFNVDNKAEVNPSQENSPTTVKSLNADSPCTYGTLYPNRIFVGHLPGKANATDLADFFSAFGTVLEGKVVLDSYGRSRRFGFVTFASHEDVQNVLSQGTIFFRGKKINVGPAVKKMFGIEMSPPSTPDNLSSGTTSPNSILLDENNNTESETIVTVPPVNERKDLQSPLSNKNGNVWMKVNAKPKSPNKKTYTETQTTHPNFIHAQTTPVQQNNTQSYPTFIYPTYYTVPYNQLYNYQYVVPPYQQNLYTPPSTPCTPSVIPYRFTNNHEFIRGPLPVS